MKCNPVCFVCGEALAVVKPPNLERHYSPKRVIDIFTSYFLHPLVRDVFIIIGCPLITHPRRTL